MSNIDTLVITGIVSRMESDPASSRCTARITSGDQTQWLNTTDDYLLRALRVGQRVCITVTVEE
jgi:hypothetical protein